MLFTMDEDCFFFIDLAQPEETRCMSILCVECRSKHMPTTGWFYQGTKDGYGDYDYQCCICQKYVHKHTEEDYEE